MNDLSQGTTTRIVLSGLEGNQPTHLKGMQVYLSPHLGALMTGWWIIFFLMLAFILTRGLLFPLFKRSTKKG